MDEQIIDMIRDQFQSMNGKIDKLQESVQGHLDDDKLYWTKIDQTDGQISLIKWIIGSGTVGAFILFVYNFFAKH